MAAAVAIKELHRDHFIFRPHSGGKQGEMQRAGPRVQPDCMFGLLVA